MEAGRQPPPRRGSGSGSQQGQQQRPSPRSAAAAQQVERMAARLEAQYPDVRHVRPEDVFFDGGGGGAPEAGGRAGRGRGSGKTRWQLVDARTAAERRVSVLPGAIALAELERRLEQEEQEQEEQQQQQEEEERALEGQQDDDDDPDPRRRRRYAIYCTIGKRSSDAVRRLARRHPRAAPRLANLRGSVLAWAHAGLPISPGGDGGDGGNGGDGRRVHCYARPWALLPEEGYGEAVVFSPLGLLLATVFPER